MWLGICLSLLASASTPEVFVPAERFTLAWMHSIERVRWEEDYRVELTAGSATPVLRATQARIRGSAAGMEPPDDARLVEGWYVYTPAQTWLPELRLTRSPYAADYEVCVADRCAPLHTWLPSDGGITRLRPCTRP